MNVISANTAEKAIHKSTLSCSVQDSNSNSALKEQAGATIAPENIVGEMLQSEEN